DSLKPGHGYLPMHWGSAFMAGHGINALTHDARDPLSFQPELKHSAVHIEAMRYRWHAAAWIQGPISLLRQRLGHWLAAFPYAVLVPSAVGGEGVRLHAAAVEKPDAALLRQLIEDLDLTLADLVFDDPARGQVRRIRCRGNQIQAFLLTGDTRAHEA